MDCYGLFVVTLKKCSQHYQYKLFRQFGFRHGRCTESDTTKRKKSELGKGLRPQQSHAACQMVKDNRRTHRPQHMVRSEKLPHCIQHWEIISPGSPGVFNLIQIHLFTLKCTFYINCNDLTLSGQSRPMNDNLRMLHCVVCLARIQAGDSLWYCSEQTDITLHDHACHDLT